MKNKFRVSKILKSALVAILLVCLVTMSIPTSFAARTPSVTKLEVNDVVVIKDTNGYLQWDYDMNGDYMEYYYYDVAYIPEFTVTLSDGSLLNGFCGSAYDEKTGKEYFLECTDDQSFDNAWGVGVHTVTAKVSGATATFNVNVIETPVASVKTNSVSIVENTNGYMCDLFDENDEYVSSYYEYSYSELVETTVTLKDGTVLTDESGFEYEGIGYIPEFYDTQEQAPWTVGNNTATGSIMGYEFDFTVEIAETPIQSLEVDNTEIIENTHLEYSYDEYDNEYSSYYYDPEFSVTLKDGSVLRSKNGYFEYNGLNYTLDLTDDQSYENKWGIGDHNVTATLMGVEDIFTVSITKTPVQSIEVPDLNIIENANLYYDFDFDTGLEYTSYAYIIPEFTVTYNNGDVVTYTNTSAIEYNGDFYDASYYDDQSYNNKWGLGKHTANIEFLGFESSFNVNVIETPVAEISFLDINLIENGNCYTRVEDDGTEWNEYVYSPPECKITMKDNTTMLCQEYEYMGQTYSLEFLNDDQSIDNQWKLGGTYNVELRMMGIQGKSKVNIIENPVVSVHIDDITVTADRFNDENYSIIDDINMVITLNDGTQITELKADYDFYNYFVEYNGQEYYINFWSDSDVLEETNLIHAEIMGKETAFNFTITGEETVKLYGDANSDGSITIADATAIQKHIARIESIPENTLLLCDLNNDKNITITDATAIQKHLAHLESSPIIGQPMI